MARTGTTLIKTKGKAVWQLQMPAAADIEIPYGLDAVVMTNIIAAGPIFEGLPREVQRRLYCESFIEPAAMKELNAPDGWLGWTKTHKRCHVYGMHGTQ